MHIVDKSRSADIEKLPKLLRCEYMKNISFGYGFDVGYDKGFLSGVIHAMRLSGISEDRINEALRGNENERS